MGMMEVFIIFGAVIALLLVLGWLGGRSGDSVGQAAFNPDAIDGAAFSDERIQAALDSGNKIEAIKLYREMTGLGLKEAKDAVEGMARK